MSVIISSHVTIIVKFEAKEEKVYLLSEGNKFNKHKATFFWRVAITNYKCWITLMSPLLSSAWTNFTAN
jgi:hypothetical protein